MKKVLSSELTWWLLFAFVASGGVWYRLWIEKFDYIGMILLESYSLVVAAAILVLFPIIFKRIFHEYPLRLLHERLQSDRYTIQASDQAVVYMPADELAALSSSKAGNKDVGKDEYESPEELLELLVANSRLIADRIYARAGVYLLIGVMVAFSGMIFFYLQSVSVDDTKEDWTSVFISLAPRFGILFFIEFIAFFFLRQYRFAMDEFRYFESIKRQREDNLAIIVLARDSGFELEQALKLVAACSFNMPVGHIPHDSTSEILEARKLTKDELTLFEKVVDSIARSK